jgi:quaternary ammonium compound-resistance protein SugE
VIGTVIAGAIYFGEPITFWRMFFLTLLVISVVGLKLVTD